jgi:CHAD domain-containing protein
MLHGVEKGEVSAVHRTRVASRRLREVLPVLQLDVDLTRKLGRRLRKVTAGLGTVRELDVMLGVIAELRTSDRHPDAALARVETVVSDARAQARARMLARLPLAELKRLAARLERIAAGLESTTEGRTPRGGAEPRSWRWAIDARVSRRASALADAVSAAGAMYMPERLHAVRIAAKKLRYAVEVSAEVSSRKFVAELRRLRALQDVLGRLHDLQVLADRVRQVQVSLVPPDITAWRQLDALMTSLDTECRRLHGRYMRGHDALVGLCARLVAPAPDVKLHKPYTKRSSR